VCRVTEVMERKCANCFWMSQLESIYASIESVDLGFDEPLGDRGKGNATSSELRYLREIEITDFHGRHDHIK